MGSNVLMPRLSLTMKEGTVGKWYKAEGEHVEKGEPIAEVISEKATYDLEAPASGVLRRIIVQAGVDAPVNAILAVVTAPGEMLTEQATETKELSLSVEKQASKVIASPAAKRLAREHGLDLSTVEGSGPEGRIDEEDVKKLIGTETGALPRIKEILPLRGIRKTSAERLAASFKNAPHSTIMMEADVSNAGELRERLEISYTSILVKAVANALAGNPIVNSTLDGDMVRVFEDINVGVAVATENGLVVPVIRNADGKTLKEIDALVVELTEKAKQSQLSKKEVTGGTFTITNLGMYGVDFFVPIINPPEAAILGAGRIVEKPVSVDGKIEVRPIMMLSLVYDHRIIDGAPASLFLRDVKHRMEKM